MVFESLQRCWWSPQALLHFQQTLLPNDIKNPFLPFLSRGLTAWALFPFDPCGFLKNRDFKQKSQLGDFFTWSKNRDFGDFSREVDDFFKAG